MNQHMDFDHIKNGYVFNIQHYSVHDGPGIRTIAFLKGCPLKCQWCANPESQQGRPEIAYNANKCIGVDECGKCLQMCPEQAIGKREDMKIEINRSLCTNCLQCAVSCPSISLNVYGQKMSVNEVIDAVEKDEMFYARSGGGLTLSGGEPLYQADFAKALLKEAKRRRINTAIETCGHVAWEQFEAVVPYLDYLLFDIKSMDEEKHQKFTTVSNQLILDNFLKLCRYYPQLPILVRTPVIPGFNDAEKDILTIMDFIKDKPNVRYEILPYHRLGQPKYDYLGRAYLLGDSKLDDEKIEILKALVKNYLNY